MVKFKLRPTRDGAKVVHRTTLYRRRIREEFPLEHSIAKAKDSLRKRKEIEKLKSDQSREVRMKKKYELEMQAVRQRNYIQGKEKDGKKQKELQQKAAEQGIGTEIESNVDIDDGTRRSYITEVAEN